MKAHGQTLLRRTALALLVIAAVVGIDNREAAAATLDAKAIGDASGTAATATADGVVRIAWARSDVAVTVDGVQLPPAAGLGSWAAFAPMGDGAMVMGDTVVFEDEVDAAIDAAFANGLAVTALHNHFFYDTPKVYFMHIGGEGKPESLAGGVRAVWAAIKGVRSAHPAPAAGFAGEAPKAGGRIDSEAIGKIVGQPATDTNGVARVTVNRSGSMHDVPIGGSMGLTTWAAFTGNEDLAAIDGDFIMAANEVQPVLHALRKGGIHIVALHNHMSAEKPAFYFTHFWAKGKAETLARAFKAALDAQAAAKP